MNATATAAKPPTESVMVTTPPVCSFPPVDLGQDVTPSRRSANVRLDTLVMVSSASLETVLRDVIWLLIHL